MTSEDRYAGLRAALEATSAGVLMNGEWRTYGEPKEADRLFIHAANPETVWALLAERDALSASYRQALESLALAEEHSDEFARERDATRAEVEYLRSASCCHCCADFTYPDGPRCGCGAHT